MALFQKMCMFFLLSLFFIISKVNGYSLNFTSNITFLPWHEIGENCHTLTLSYTKDFLLKNSENLKIKMEVYSMSVRSRRPRKFFLSDVTCINKEYSGYCKFSYVFSPEYTLYSFEVYLKNDSYRQLLAVRENTTFFLEDIRGPLEVFDEYFDQHDGIVQLKWYQPWLNECDAVVSFAAFQFYCESDTVNNSCFHSKEPSLIVEYDSDCVPVHGNNSYSYCTYILKGLVPFASYYNIRVRYTTFYYEDPTATFHWSKYSNTIQLRQLDDNTTQEISDKGNDDGYVKMVIIVCSVVFVTILVFAVAIGKWLCRTKVENAPRDIYLVEPRTQSSVEVKPPCV